MEKLTRTAMAKRLNITVEQLAEGERFYEAFQKEAGTALRVDGAKYN